jgi:hypothetical protein
MGPGLGIEHEADLVRLILVGLLGTPGARLAAPCVRLSTTRACLPAAVAGLATRLTSARVIRIVRNRRIGQIRQPLPKHPAARGLRAGTVIHGKVDRDEPDIGEHLHRSHQRQLLLPTATRLADYGQPVRVREQVRHQAGSWWYAVTRGMVLAISIARILVIFF